MPATVGLYDTFTRTTTTPDIGTADVGGAWTNEEATQGTLACNGSALLLTATGNSFVLYSKALSVAMQDIDLNLTVATSRLSTGGKVTLEVDVRRIGDPHTDRAYATLAFTTTPTITLALGKTVASVDSTVVAATSAGSYAIDTLYRLRVQFIGTTLRAKVWAASAAEPSTWLVSGTVSDAALQATGHVILNVYAGSGSTNSGAVYTIDDLIAVDAFDTVNLAANAHTVVATGWTNPSNAYATTGDDTYATALDGSASKNISWSGDFGFANVLAATIPDGAYIAQVRMQAEAKLSATVTGGIFGIQGRNNAANSGTEGTTTSLSDVAVPTILGPVTLADLRSASSLLKARCRGAKGNTASALTVSLDYARLEVDYATPAANVTVTPGLVALTLTPLTPTITASDHKLVTPGTVALTTSLLTPSVTLGFQVVPGVVALTTTPFTPTVTTSNHQLVTPGVASLTLTPLTPTAGVSDNKLVTPGVVALTLSPLTPGVTASDHQTATPGVVSLTLTPLAPTVTAAANQTATPDPASLTLTALTPAVTASDHQLVTPGVVSLTLTPLTPTVTANAGQTVTPGVVSLTLTPLTPTVTATANVTATPDLVALTLSPFAPTVTAGGSQTVTPGTAALSLTAFAPDTVLSDHQLVTPGTATLTLTPLTPSVGQPISVVPGPLGLTLTPFAPVVATTAHVIATPGTASLGMTAFAPNVVASDHQLITPGTLALTLTALTPTVTGAAGLSELVDGGIVQIISITGEITAL